MTVVIPTPGPVELRDDAPVGRGDAPAAADRLRGRGRAGGRGGLPPEHQEAGAGLREVPLPAPQVMIHATLDTVFTSIDL